MEELQNKNEQLHLENLKNESWANQLKQEIDMLQKKSEQQEQASLSQGQTALVSRLNARITALKSQQIELS